MSRQNRIDKFQIPVTAHIKTSNHQTTRQTILFLILQNAHFQFKNIIWPFNFF